MSLIESLSILNDKITKLFDDYKKLSSERDELEKRKNELVEENKRLRQERDEIKKRIEELINKIP